MEYPEDLVSIEVPNGWIELRIHGVSGTPPEELLRGHPVRVAGDRLSGFYRKEGTTNLEAYSWGGLTSGTKRQAFWLLLLPFSLINVAGWMTPPDMSNGMRRTHGALVRVMAFVASAATILFASVLLMDLFAWRTPAAVSEPKWLKAVMRFWLDVPLNSRLAIATLLVALIVVALGWLGRTTRRSYESLGPAAAGVADPAPTASFDDLTLWGTRLVGDYLAPSHGGVGLGIVAMLAGWTALESWKSTPLILGGIAIVTTLFLVVVLAFRSRFIGSRLRHVPLGLGGVAAAWAFFELLVVDLDTRPRPVDTPLDAPIVGFFIVVLVVIALLLALLFVGRAVAPAGVRGHSFALSAVAMSALAATGSGVVLLAEEVLDRQRSIYDAFDWLGILFTVSIVVLITVSLYLWDPLGPRTGTAQDRSRQRFGRLHDTVARGSFLVGLWGWSLAVGLLAILGVGLLTGDAPTVGFSFLRTPPLDNLDFLWLVLGLPLLVILCRMVNHGYWARLGGVILAGLIVAALWISLDQADSLIPTLSFPRAASYLGLVLPAVGVGFLILRARSDRKIRQSIGIVWDLANYWPRWYHPWASPPYTEIAIPELVDRIDQLTAGGAKVVVSAHSQGAVMSVPVILRGASRTTASATTDTLGFLSYGNLIGTVYHHLFPHYFTLENITDLNTTLNGRWRNLYRDTDPLGDGIDGIERQSSIPPFPLGPDKLLTHSNYQYNTEYQDCLLEVTEPGNPQMRGGGVALEHRSAWAFVARLLLRIWRRIRNHVLSGLL